jgi:hypothetical protein
MILKCDSYCIRENLQLCCYHDIQAKCSKDRAVILSADQFIFIYSICT